MKQDEIIEMAKTVGIKYKPVLQEFHSEFRNGIALEDIEEFVKLLDDKEREVKEHNFCPRCGKRTADLTTIHTCTPPQD